ncbi:MAG: hypothetical protein DCC88_00995 [Spirobacillus cienkowskii]|uniref:Uncharacterized protein n=2 Tax=Spirobacillus cienkowskii TaxID=495820 RepID=A0A369L176_9BACT|nr:MAG: hypothetical protein DCC88_00995 [Spirobacillus cienkowskii]
MNIIFIIQKVIFGKLQKSIFLGIYMKISIILSLICLFTYGCGSVRNFEKGENLLAWVGLPISEVLRHPKFGIPDIEKSVGNERIITYNQNFAFENNNTLSIFCSRSFVYGVDLKINKVILEGSCQNNDSYLPNSSKIK